MSKREEAIEAMVKAFTETPCFGETLRGLLQNAVRVAGVEWDETAFQRDMRSITAAAFDAAVNVLMEPSDAMVDWGFQSIRMDEKWPELMRWVFKAMLAASA